MTTPRCDESCAPPAFGACATVFTIGCEYVELHVYRGIPSGEVLAFSTLVEGSAASVLRSVAAALASVPDAYVYAHRRWMGRRRTFAGQFGRGAGRAWLMTD